MSPPCFPPTWILDIDHVCRGSEEEGDDDAMAVDGDGDGGKPPVGSGGKTDDLAEYRLDEYDDDVNDEGAPIIVPFSPNAFRFSILVFFRDWSVHKYQGVDVLPR